MGTRIVSGVAPVLASVLVLLSPPAVASLAPDDASDLAASLEVLARGADAAAATQAAEIYARPGYDAADLAEFFAGFFDDHPCTDPLFQSLSAAALTTPSEETREGLQEALASGLVASIDATLHTHLPDGLGPALASDPALFEDLRSSLWLLADLAWQGEELSIASRRGSSARLARLIAAYPEVLRKEATISVVTQPRVAALRAQLFKVLRDLPRPFDRESFVADAGFPGPYAEIVRRHGVLVLDNNGLDARQLDAIDQVLTAIPSSLYSVTHISQYNFLGAQPSGGPEVPLRGSPGLNIFGTPVEHAYGNPFPPDIEPRQDRLFCAVVQHEVNHAVDAQTVNNDPRLSRRRDELIARAGSDPMHYLSSNVPPGFFRDSPQEFFASIANMYLTDSAYTLVLALKRLEEGRTEPLDQFLFFAEVYSQGRDSTLFFHQDKECNYSAYLVSLGRDGAGRIERIGDSRFQLDRGGNVVR